MTTLLDHGAYSSRRQLRGALLIAAALVAASCSDAKVPTTPTTFGIAGTSSSASISALSDNIVAQPVGNFFCPTVAPFTAPFVILVHSNGLPGLVVTQLRMQFTDSAGMHMPSVTLPAPVSTQEFGSELTAARELRFPLALGVGCGAGRTGVIEVGFDAHDRSGHRSSGQTKITVR